MSFSGPLAPDQCTTKDDVRAQIDQLDLQLIKLLAQRHQYVIRMAEIKTNPDEAHDQNRIDAVIEKVRQRARDHRLDADQAALLWQTLIDWNVNFEKGVIAARQNQNR